ncbi:MAG: dihydroorotate dehydrogenase-like protein [Bacteroidales bacterium]
MGKLRTNYMGIELENPIIAGASNMSADLDKLKEAEDAGVGAIVFKSLFEEQIQLERFQLDESLSEYNDIHAEMITTHPDIDHAGPDEHLMNVKKAKESLSVPLIASLNAVNHDTWVIYAKLLAEAGVDALELNFYSTPDNPDKGAAEIEDEQVRVVKEIKKSVSLPVSVKLSSEYTNVLNMVKKLEGAGAEAFVLFNSFFQPDIDIVSEEHIKMFSISNEGDYRQSLRYAGLLFDNIKSDICSSRGIYSSADIIKLILAGSSAVQVVSTLYKNGVSQIGEMKKEMEEWMEQKGYNSVDEFRGKLSRKRLTNPFVYRRAQYVDLIINSEELFINPLRY